MTICAGFHCGDGIVLCADTQETVSNYIKRNVPKLEVRPRNSESPDYKGPKAIFAGAGDGDFIDHLIEKLWSAMKSKGTMDEMVEAIEKQLTFRYKQLVPIYTGGMPEAVFLVGLYSAEGDLELLKINGAIVKREVLLDAIGCGDILATYVLNHLVGPKSSFSSAVPFALYMISEVKENVRECGGETHLCTVDYDGKINRLTQAVIESRVQRIKEAEIIARQIGAATIENGPATDAFSEWLDNRIKRLKEIKAMQP